MDPAVNVNELILLFISFCASAFFSGTEAVLMSLGVDRAQQIVQEGGSRKKIMTFLIDRPNELLSTILIGNNVANVFAASLSTTMAARYFKNDAIGISVGLTTFIILIFGEVIPKTFARTHAERLAVPVLRVLKFLYYALYPIVRFMVWIITTLLGENAELTGRFVRKRDIAYMISKAEKEKTIDSKQVDLLTSVLEFPTIKVKDIMIPRSQVKFLKVDSSVAELIETVRDAAHSRYPVCDSALENTMGFLHVKDLALINDEERKVFNIRKILKAPFFVYEHMKIQAVFDHMNRKKVHLALIKDEHELVVGIITLEDIIEEVFGEIQDEHDKEELEVMEEYRSDDLKQGIIIEGSMSIRDLDNDYDIKIPLNDHYSTVAGFILDMLGNNFPETGQIIVWRGYSFEIFRVDEYAIRRVRIKDVDDEKHIFSKKEAQESQDKRVSSSSNDATTTKYSKTERYS